MEEREGLDNTSDEDIVNLASSHESNNEQVTAGYSDDVSSVVEQVREENEDIWFIGVYDIYNDPLLLKYLVQFQFYLIGE